VAFGFADFVNVPFQPVGLTGCFWSNASISFPDTPTRELSLGHLS
jgi:hypothetical protein